VFREAVTEGKARGYPDAVALEQLIPHAMQQKCSPPQRHTGPLLPSSTLGAGEAEALALYFSEQADALLSDDRAFLHLLGMHQIPALTPAAVVVTLCAWGLMTVPHARQALRALRPLIRLDQYHAAWADLAALERK
jgi:hypothetical protein